MMNMRIVLTSFGLLALFAFSQTTLAQETLAQSLLSQHIPLESFAKLPYFENPQISPDGKHIAVQRLHEGMQVFITFKASAVHLF